MSKPPFDPRAEYARLKAKIDNGGGMTAQQWDWFDARMKQWEPEEFERRRQEARVRIAIEFFEERLKPLGYALIPPPLKDWTS